MNPEKLSRQLSYVLRHKPESIGIALDRYGWANTKELMAAMKISFDDLCSVVKTDAKQRYAFSDEQCTKIRANQGHSIEIELGYKPKIPTSDLYHGTNQRFLDSIKQQGIQKKNRHHVHLSDNYDTAFDVGSRHGNRPRILIVAAQRMQTDGFTFFLSDNNVWLTDQVPWRYVTLAEIR